MTREPMLGLTRYWSSDSAGPLSRMVAVLGTGVPLIHLARALAGGDSLHHGLSPAALVLTLGAVLMAAAAAARLTSRRTTRTPVVIGTAAAATLTAYLAAELAQGAVSAHHPAAVDTLYGPGGWVVLLLALACGLVVAALVRTAKTVLAAIGSGRLQPRSPLRTELWETGSPDSVPPSVLACNLAGRAPPLALPR